MNYFYLLVIKIFFYYFRIFHSLKIYGLENIVEGAAIIAPNHVSFWDPPLIASSCPTECHFLAKDVLFKNKLLGYFISKLNAHPVSGKQQDITTFKMIAKLLKEKDKVVIFPEGIRTYDGKLGEIKPGIGMVALRNNCPIIPTYIHGTYEVWPREKKFPKLGGKISCIFGAPIYPEKYKNLGKREAQNALTEDLKNSLLNLEKKLKKLVAYK